jgi:exosome complex RNA-binding protein Rrp42 (RNase PH superfamily)
MIINYLYKMFNIVSNTEKQFFQNHLNNGQRIDGRDLENYRDIVLTKLGENGQVETRIGNTLVISQIFCKLISPNRERPGEGVIVFTIDTNSLRSNAEFNISNEELGDLRNKINNLLDKSLRETKYIAI